MILPKYLCPHQSSIKPEYLLCLAQSNPLLIPYLLLQLRQQLSRRLLTVTLGVILGPAPEILAGLLEGVFGGPAELGVGAGRVGSQVEDVTGATRGNLVGEVAAHGGGEGLDHLVDGGALAGAEVPGADAGVVLAQVVQGLQVAVGQVEDVDVVADGGAVVRGVVCAEVLTGAYDGNWVLKGSYHRRTPSASRACRWQPGRAEEAGCMGHPGGPHP